MAVTMREAWTDERLDDLSARVEAGFAQTHVDITELRREVRQGDEALRTETGTLRAEIGTLRTEMNSRFAAVELRMDKLETRLDRMTLMILGTLIAGFAGLFLGHLG